MEHEPGKDTQDQRGPRPAEPMSKAAALHQLDTFARRFAIGAPIIAAVNNIATLISGYVPGPIHLGLHAAFFIPSVFAFAILAAPLSLTAGAHAADPVFRGILTEVLRSEKRLRTVGGIFFGLAVMSLLTAANADVAMIFQIPLLTGAVVMIRRRYVSYVDASRDATSGVRLRPLLDASAHVQ
ncbi:MAG: hypothetical protein ACRDTU_11315 [Micromonosporaceae bacterium]